jgi:hypothetical protein
MSKWVSLSILLFIGLVSGIMIAFSCDRVNRRREK